MKNIPKKICVLISKPYKKINAQILNGIQKQALALGWNVVVFSINDRKEAEDIFHGECNLLHAINYQMFDGVIFVLESFSSPECIDLIIRQLKDKCREKTVCISEKLEDFDFECVSGNSRKSFQEITEHMIYVHNCRRICCLTGPKDNPASLERLEGYRDAMNAAGLNIEKNDVYFGDFWINSSEKYAEILLSEGLPDAVVCGNDIMAIYLCKYLLAAGVKIPDDVRVSGFDDTIEAAINSPIISTYSVDFNAIGMRAVSVLLSKLTDIDLGIENDDSSHFAANESCGCYPERKEYQQQIKGNAYIMNLEERYLDSSHQYWMLSSDNLQDYIHSLYELTFLFLNPAYYEKETFCVCLCTDWQGSTNESGHTSFRTEGYTSEMIGILNGCPQKLFSQKELMPRELIISDVPTCTFVNALHFKKQCFGYALLQRKGIADSIPAQFLRFCQDIGISLGFLNIQNRIKLMTRRAYISELRDELTGIYKLNALYSVISSQQKIASETGQKIFILSVEIFSLSRIMEIYGHEEYENVICQTAQTLLGCCRSGEICIRSDENSFLLVGIRERNSDSVNLLKNDILMQLERINASGQRPFGITLNFSDQTVNLAAVQSEISNKPEIQDRRRSRYYSALLSLRKMIYDEPAQSWNMNYCAELLNLSTSYFQRLYENTFGIKCSEDIRKSRLRYARKLLFETDLTLNEIAEKCGYAYQNFMRAFKRRYGVTPTEFRKGKKKI